MSKLYIVQEALEAVNKPFEPLTPGEYSGVVKEMRETTIRNGRHAGKKSIDVAVQLEDGRYLWKVLPQFTAAQHKKLNEGDRKWYTLSTVSFFQAVQETELSAILGKTVKFLVGMHQDNGYGPQNSIVKFIK